MLPEKALRGHVFVVEARIRQHEAVGPFTKRAINRNKLQALTVHCFGIHPDPAFEKLARRRTEEFECDRHRHTLGRIAEPAKNETTR